MASAAPQYDQLPVYKAAYDLVRELYRSSRISSVPRDVRYTLVERIKNDSADVLGLIYRAYYADDEAARVETIMQARQTVPTVKARLRIMYELHYITVKTFMHFAELTVALSDQLDAWHAKRLRKLRAGYRPPTEEELSEKEKNFRAANCRKKKEIIELLKDD